MRSNTAVYLLLLLAIAISATFVVADPNAPTDLNQISSTKGDLSTLPAQSANAQGGNVTEINIEALTVTRTWQGYYGNVTGQITLQDGSNNTFYNWSVATPSGEVYATRTSTISWTSVNCTNAGNRTLEETYLNHTAAEDDSVTNTFNSTTHAAFAVGSNTILANTCYTTYGYVNNETQSTDFVMLLLNSGANIIYTTILDDNTVGFDGREHDFQLLVGENERNNTAVTPYYFWVELS
jgi:hypothetical protein